MAPVSIFKKPGAQKFQLVHKSQSDKDRDPNDDKGVLKQIDKKTVKPGDAANFGIYYDDREYDYTQHLRTIGGQDAFGQELDSVLITAPDPKAEKKSFILRQQQEKDAQDEAIKRAYENQASIPLELQGFNPDMDPALRQTLEALDDEAYLEDLNEEELDEEDDDNEWFDDLLGDGLRGKDEVIDFGPDEEEDPAITARKERERQEYETAKANGEDLSQFHTEDWMQKFREFKLASKDQPSPPASDDLPSDEDEFEEMSDYHSEGADTVGSLRTGIGAARTRRKLRKAGSDASGYSMSSSSMFRNDGLQSLDAQFDRIEEEYNSEEDEDEEEDEEEGFDPTSDLNVHSREDFDSILDEFLDKYEVVGGRVQQKLEGDTPAEKLQTMRLAMADLAPKGDQIKKYEDAASKRITSAYRIATGEEEDDDSNIPMPFDVDAKEDRMDAQTILTTYTNTENHPTKIRSQDLLSGRKKEKKEGPVRHVAFAEKEDVAPVRKVQIVVDPKTGFPMEIGEDGEVDDEESEEEEEAARRPKKQTVSRNRNESKEEKKARKQAAKTDKQNRKVEKKETKEAFANERKSQISKTANAKQSQDVTASMKL
ncbi:hypothetical protein E3Q19_03888 [Wallemia mellicola]|nr:hypothetical protein E3Q19_03888 [Wallemia mellicola]TIC41115.1 hypothetical protein E3Q08_03458 [Wallemia mellicola]TIC72554.1 hypothetical protein E3Q00_03869 [Wallemia mellicola]